MVKRKRERLEIIRDILGSIKSSKKIRPTKLLSVSNLSPQMFKEYISELKRKGFLEEIYSKDKKYFILKEKGSKFLIEYGRVTNFIQNFGL